jgi:putative serine protease PepD
MSAHDEHPTSDGPRATATQPPAGEPVTQPVPPDGRPQPPVPQPGQNGPTTDLRHPGYGNPLPPPPPYGAPPAAPLRPEPRPRTRWLPLATTATAAALVASLATAGLTGAFDEDRDTTASQASAATQQEQAPAPVEGSTSEQPDWESVAGAVRASVVAIDVVTGSGAGKGSGVILDAKGHILTNNHVVGDAAKGGLQVTLFDGRVFDATIVGLDPTTDLAVVALVDAPKDLSPARLGDSDALKVGESVMAVGNPLGLDSTVTTGIVSALDRPVATSDGGEAVVTNAIQIDAAVNPGNSGGPLFDAQGRVIGITSSIASLPGPSGQAGSIGLGFAIPVALASRIADELIVDGTAEHAFLGVSLGAGTATAEGTTRRGAVVQEVTEGSPAAKAGIQQGDVVVAMDEQPVNGPEALTALVRAQEAGSTAQLTVVRGERSMTVDVTFAVREELVPQG